MRPRSITSSAPALAAGASVLLWASAFVVIRFAGRSLEPGPLALARLVVGSIALGGLMLARHEQVPRGRALGGAIASGLLWFGVYNLALNGAERRIDAGSAALLVNVAPILIALMAATVLREGLSRTLLIGCAVSFCGVALIGAGVSIHGASATLGAGLCLLAALAYSAGLIVQKPALREASALSVTWVACTVATIACLPYGPALVGELGRARSSTIVWATYLGLGPTAIGFGAWSFALSRTEVSKLGVTTYLVPPLSTLLGWLALGETPPLLALPGGILCLAGVALSRRANTTPRRSKAAGLRASRLARADRRTEAQVQAPGRSSPARRSRSRR